MTDLRLGDYRDVLVDVTCDALICDPPYGAKTHDGHDSGAKVRRDGSERRKIDYTHWTEADVAEFVAFWAPRTRGWMVAMTSHDLIGAWQSAYLAAGRYAFAPVWILQNSVRLCGDGPASPGIYLMVARPRTIEFARWGALPGHYASHRAEKRVVGAKSLELMRSIVADYSREGNLVCDPCAGHGSTLYAARQCGRLAVGAEIDPTAHGAALGANDGDSEGQLVML